MTVNISTAVSRELGADLRQLRERETPYTARTLSTALGWDHSKVSTIECGRARASELDLVQYLALCGLKREEIEEFYARYRFAFEPYQLRLPENLRTLALAESTATKITSYDLVTIPGLLQTREYATALFGQIALTPAAEFATWVQARMDRQLILRRAYRPECTFFVHENALRRQVGGSEVMAAQMTRLMFHTHVVRVVPDAPYLAAYKLLQYEKDKPIAFTESDLAQVFAQDPAAIARCKLLFERLDEMALDEAQSRALLMKYVDMYDEPRRGAQLA